MHIRKLTPSMSLLTAFDAAARSESFTKAGAELFLTQSAVSRQVQTLERQLDVSLFDRSGKNIALTEAGKLYASEVSAILARLRAATLRVKDAQARAMSLQLAVLPILGSKWLMPRLAGFHYRHPEVQLTLHARTGAFDLLAAGMDGCLTLGDGHWPAAERHFLFNGKPLVVGSPALLRERPVRKVEDLLGHSLLHITRYSSGWKEQLLATGIDPRAIQLGLQFEYTAHLIQAVIDGIGLGLVSDIYLANELASGQLAAPRIQGWHPPAKRYYFICSPNSDEKPALRLFKAWLLEEAATFDETESLA